MANPIKKCVLHGAVNNETVDLYPRTNLASINDMTAFARTLNGAADAAAARTTMGISTTTDIINIIYPVGSVITLTNDTDPNKIYAGTTWQKMDAGRVLVSAGTYTEDGETYTYTLGDKGGEAKHQNTIEEMPPHNHSASVSTVGDHTHSVGWADEASPKSGGIDSQSNTPQNPRVWTPTSGAGNHGHTVTINSVGGGQKANNMPPYNVAYMWHRTA